MKNYKKLAFRYKEIINLIPSIQEAILMALERDRIFYKDIEDWIKIKAQLYNSVFEIIQGKWMIEILYTMIIIKSCGFNELKQILPKKDSKTINSRTLTDRLRFLEQRRFISRTVQIVSPIRVKYELTKFGKEAFSLLIPFLIYNALSPSILKTLPKLQTIEKSVVSFINEEAENLKI
ncbi:MAG: winged helix-turn-helix transcriptional regulator [Promethearchaeota archaeon]